MQVFNWSDNQQREWNLSLTYGDARKVHRQTGVDLLNTGETADIVGLTTNRSKLADVLWLMSEKEAKAQGVSQDDFFDALDSDALGEGWEALAEAYMDFTPAGQRPAVQAALAKQILAMEQTALELAKAIESPEADQAIQQAIQGVVATATTALKTLGQSDSNSPGVAA